MDYLYENLGDERFQEFCTVLIAKEFPNLQAFPVGQPDGGRDSLVYFMDSPPKDFIVFQVKFVRNPKSIPDCHKWLTDTLKVEAPKIQKLIPDGAKEFYLLTNVDGTAHLKDGSKDKVNKILEDNISIPAQCWWRDDISRRFEKDPIFQWGFPTILNGQNILNSLIFQNINENKANREAVINAYISDQYKIDNEVKFKQIDLQNKLIDLYTDVPLHIKEINQKNKKLIKVLESVELSNMQYEHESHIFHSFIHKKESIGAAKFLLDPNIQNGIERILLEGGPGQGKSTISQYICQVHRAKLLNKTDDLKLLPDNIRNYPIRIPFKVDLRHIASWIEKKNPYDSQLNEEVFNCIWAKALESFMVGHISYHSPNNKFQIEDIFAIIKNHPILIVFDGFDEIADVKIRQEVIDLIDRGIERLKAHTKFIQVLITSRPAAFSTSSFPIDTYPHFELTDITPACTKEYVDKWIKANKLGDREGNEIRKLVDEKLQISHLRELAKSPMQLAIFISLLRTRGESLPNKRTALYDSYIDLFFNREAEKNQIIRENRELIIDIHKYLAWVLHSEAELYNHNGTITVDLLTEKIKSYLEKEGHKSDIAELFQAVQERVCALVSRVQGTYEFEIQPLREYFCAKYLYQTAPYSPAGQERTGTKPERFNAISRDFYWNNVVRFYAGCFDKGELPMLVDELKELQNDELLKYTNYPRLLTSQLLSDWVFTQSPKFLKDVVEIIVDGINIGAIINQNSHFWGNDESILLPDECGRIEIIKECFKQLKHFPHSDYVNELIGLIVNNPHKEVLELWNNELKNIPDEKTLQWLEYAYRMRIIHKIDGNVLLDIILKDTNVSTQEQKIQIIINGNRFDVINHNLQLKQIALEGILSGEIFALSHNKRKTFDSSLRSLSILLYPFMISTIIYGTEDRNGKFIDFLQSRFGYDFDDERDEENLFSENASNDSVDKLIDRLYKNIDNSLNSNLSEWKKNLEKWDSFVEELRDIFKDKWAFKILSTIVAGIKDKNLVVMKEYQCLSDSSLSLCKRTQYAHSQSGNLDYWKQQLNQSSDLVFICLMFLTWATPRVILKLYENVQRVISQLVEKDIWLLSNSLKKTIGKQNEFKKSQVKEIIDSPQFNLLPFEIQYLISHRFPDSMQQEFIGRQNNDTATIFKIYIAKAKFKYLVDKYLKNVKNISLLDEIKKHYELSTNSYIGEYIAYHYFRFNNDKEFVVMPIDIAKNIMKTPKSYPRLIASIAEKSCRLYANEHVKIVGQVANEKKWFD
jgi:hypothetical protein